MRVIPERAPLVPKADAHWDELLGHGVLHLGDRRIPLRAVYYTEAHIRYLVNRECLRLLVHRLGIPLRFLAPRLACGCADLPCWMLGDSGWMVIVSLAEQGAKALEVPTCLR